MKAFKSILPILIVNLMVLVGFFFVLEVAVRAYAHFFVDDLTFFRERTFISPFFTSDQWPPPKINDMGDGLFRYETHFIPREKPTDQIRIIAVGGSTTVNQRPYPITGKAYPELVEDHLRAKFPNQDIEIYNAGAPAFSSAHSLINIQLRIAEFDPDITS